MKLRSAKARGHIQGFTLVEALFAMGMAGIMFTALYCGLAFGFKLVKMARENSRATQIMVEKMETIRLYTWTQVTNPAFIPSAFTNAYYSVNGTNSGVLYLGRISVTNCPVGATNAGSSYASNMRKVTIQLNWGTLGNTNHTRIMSTYVTRNGLQNYVY
jgi:type II secretory pathway pseudopilin PulG